MKKLLIFGFLALLSYFPKVARAGKSIFDDFAGTGPALPPEMNQKPPKRIADLSKRLDELSQQLSQPAARQKFIELFPKTGRGLFSLCSDLSYQSNLPTGDCHEIILFRGLTQTIEFPDTLLPTSKLMVSLASEVKFDADAPNYLQEVSHTLCAAHTKEFAESMKGLSRKKQGKALKFMNANFHSDDREGFVQCMHALKGAQFIELSDLASNYLREKHARQR